MSISYHHNIFRKYGHDVLAIQEKRVLITRDMHFCNILKFPPENYNGIIVLKIRLDNISLVHDNLINFLKKYAKDKIEQTLIIIDHNKFRIRR